MRLLIVVNVDWFFLSHRLPVALGALRDGYKVHIATEVTLGRELLEAHGFVVHPLRFRRNSINPIFLLRLFSQLMYLFWALRPDVAHLVTIKPVLIGGIAARFSPVGGVVYAVSGLGHVFVAKGTLGLLRRKIVEAWYRFVLRVRNMRIIFQNPHDRSVIESVARLSADQVVMIPGSGVDLSEYRSEPLPEGVPVVLMAARLIGTKGVREFVSAAQQLRTNGVDARFWLVGAPDLDNPASIQPEELAVWREEGHVEVLGHREDIPNLMALAQMVVLPSYYGEGLPKVLIEAAACGRAVVTTDMPGCREAVESGVSGLLVPARDSTALAEAIRELLEDRARCQAMGRAGRAFAETYFDIGTVVEAHLATYRALAQARANELA